MKKINTPLARFIIVGVINTGNYYLFYLCFIHLFGLKYLISHVLAFIISMVGSFFMNSLFTYRARLTFRKFFKFPLTYVVNICVTTSAMYILVELLHLNKDFSPLVASVIAIPFTFAVSKKILQN